MCDWDLCEWRTHGNIFLRSQCWLSLRILSESWLFTQRDTHFPSLLASMLYCLKCVITSFSLPWNNWGENHPLPISNRNAVIKEEMKFPLKLLPHSISSHFYWRGFCIYFVKKKICPNGHRFQNQYSINRLIFVYFMMLICLFKYFILKRNKYN